MQRKPAKYLFIYYWLNASNLSKNGWPQRNFFAASKTSKKNSLTKWKRWYFNL